MFFDKVSENTIQHILIGLLCIITAGETVFAQSLVFPPYGHSYGIRKATQFHLTLLLPLTVFDDPQGLATAKMHSRNDPSTKHDDDEVVVYGVNSGNHQLIYNTSMWGLDVYGGMGSGKDKFLYPKGVACDPGGNVYVVDAGNNRIVHLFNPKKKVVWVKAFDGRGTGSAGLNAPSQVSLDGKGRIYVTDTGNRRIVVFDSSGAVVRTITGADSCQFIDGPTTIAVADGKVRWSFFGNEQYLFCADKQGKRLWKLDFSGRVVKRIRMPKEYSALYGATDYYHNLYVTDKNNHCVLKFDHNLKLLDIFGSFGRDDNQFVEPRGIAIWKRYGQTFVAEKTGAQYFWIGTRLKQAGLWRQDTTARFFIKTNAVEYSYLSLFYIHGADTTRLANRLFINPGRGVIPFVNNTLKDPHSGSFCVRVEPTYSSYTYFQWEYPLTLSKSESAVPSEASQAIMVKKKGDKGKKMGLDEIMNEVKKHKKDN